MQSLAVGPGQPPWRWHSDPSSFDPEALRSWCDAFTFPMAGEETDPRLPRAFAVSAWDRRVFLLFTCHWPESIICHHLTQKSLGSMICCVPKEEENKMKLGEHITSLPRYPEVGPDDTKKNNKRLGISKWGHRFRIEISYSGWRDIMPHSILLIQLRGGKS